ncbi:4'-phosphopantetheinyl transferase family protein [Streptomyces sp. NPDC058412]|uniref:4'-phosphopantetheinyl transferase family protein n=1 Tax=Streptomyces sp. NPDC058412 TaxID=3346486 RepID=UPI0036562599
MIEHVNQLCGQPPHIGPPPTDSTPIVWAWSTSTETLGGHPVNTAAAILDTNERTRAERMIKPADRHRYLASHLGLRIILGAYTDLPPQHIRLTREDCPTCGGPHGRPTTPDSPLHFNLSHSGDLAYLALATRPTGIDVELTPTPQTVTDILHTLHPTETDELTSLPEDQRPQALARIWTRKEAILKATGHGLAEGLTHPYVGSHPTPAAIPGYTLTDLPAPDHYTAALATANPAE